MTEIKIRCAELADYEAIHKVWTSPIVMRETLGIPYVSVDATRKQLENLPPIEQLLVAEVDGQVVGILGLHVRRNRMSHMAGLGMGILTARLLRFPSQNDGGGMDSRVKHENDGGVWEGGMPWMLRRREVV